MDPAVDAGLREMVDRQISQRGVRDIAVLRAMQRVPRASFVPSAMREFATSDSALPIEAGQTISQPYIVARMIEALQLRDGEKVLEIGTGSGYAAAVLAEIAEFVYTIERIPELADIARQRLKELGYDNVQVVCADGTRGWGAAAPYDAIVVAAGGPTVPPSLREQLGIGGRLVLPVGPTPREQRLIRVRRVGEDEWREEHLEAVRFVPLIGDEGWSDDIDPIHPEEAPVGERGLHARIEQACEPFAGIDDADLTPLIRRLADAEVVLLGESTHGTSEFYRLRARITRELIERHGFDIVAVEADWPDAARIDAWARERDDWPSWQDEPSRFPTWMWHNREVAEFADWLREHNTRAGSENAAAFYGLDLYSLHASIAAVLAYLDSVDADAARVARERYGCLSPWEGDPMAYGRAAATGRHRDCEREVVRNLSHLLENRLAYAARDGARFFDAEQNARLVAGAERYYRTLYRGSEASWNVRDSHMFDTLRALLSFHGPQARAVVWAHNSHLGDARATEMSARGEHNLGQLVREAFGDRARLCGFGTDHGRVAAASAWDAPVRRMDVRPAHPESYERVLHDVGVPRFVLPLRDLDDDELHESLRAPRLQRAIGVVYRPETEVQSHYFQAVLPDQFDDFVWVDETDAVEPLHAPQHAAVPDTWPFGV